ncbi:hypothetical protein HGRIS_007958 [Hohenbuehelia grisea]|uniref:Uncharacterized protein n=1 Tax=Hohenbuehelia grisea TaxID=104357 RepID=A0ABR3J6Y6_9AGAR
MPLETPLSSRDDKELEQVTSKHSVEADSVQGENELVEVPRHEELRLLWKYDTRILPPLAFMYLCNALDKGNVGNAKTDGWDKVIFQRFWA